MAFSRILVLDVRARAAYRCCYCTEFGLVDAHHVVPQGEGGSDDFENAVPLCPKCHRLFGGNPELRSDLRAKRDWWYKVAAHKFPVSHPAVLTAVAQVDRDLRAVQLDAEALADLRRSLVQYVDQLLASVDEGTAPGVAATLLDSVLVDNGVLLPKNRIAAEGFCECEREDCVGHSGKAYCFWPDDLSPWVIQTRQYWQCYDEIVTCPMCRAQHKRGHVGKPGACDGARN